jgi:hypothetical protein
LGDCGKRARRRARTRRETLRRSVAGVGAYNRLVYFTESLGTFATGYLLPATP